MSSLLQSLQTLSTQRGLPASQAGSGQPSAQGAPFGVGSQAFSSLMNQFREGQGQPSPQINVAPPASASGNAALRARTAERSAKPSPPQTPRPNTAQRDAGESRTSAAAAERAKVAAKAHQAKPPSPPTANKPASPDRPRQDEATVAESAKVEDRAEDTVHADPASATAWVRELQPPADVSSSDPASMLAWLSSLAQSDASAGTAEMAEEGATSESAANRSLPAGMDAKTPAAPGWAVQAAALSDHGGDAAQGQAKDQAGAFSLESLGMAPVSREESLQASPLDFNALMAREIGRAASPVTSGAESLRHHTGSLATPVNSPDFQQALADRVGLWINGAANGPMTAELSLNPTEMGPVQIRIVLDGQSAQVDFAAAHAETRQAIEASLPALSSALEEAGLSLSGGGVSDQSARQSWQGQSSEQPKGWMRGGQEAQGREVVLTPPAAAGLNARAGSGPGGLDLYA